MKALYDSGWHHPLAAYLAGAVVLWLLVRRLPFLPGYFVFFTVAILADATVTGAWSPLEAGSPLAQPLAILFVILGDLRVFVLGDRMTRPGASAGSVLGKSIAVSLVVPVVTGLGSRLVPALAEPRVLFLVYELMLFGLVAALQLGVWRRRETSPERARCVRRVSVFVMVQYAGWALADVVILSGLEAGHLLRIVPNVAYYAAFLPFVWAVAPPNELEVRA